MGWEYIQNVNNHGIPAQTIFFFATEKIMKVGDNVVIEKDAQGRTLKMWINGTEHKIL
jgi:hypothetical protein